MRIDSAKDLDARDCENISEEQHEEMTAKATRVGAMLGGMLNHPDRFLLKTKRP